LKKYCVKVRPLVAALDSGEVRALWKTAEREQVGIHFKSAGDVNYVFFYLEDGSMKRIYDNASAEKVAAILTEKHLWRLLGA
jgi:hypothetical protein